MPTFTYQAKQGPTQVVEGTIEAATQEEVVSRLLRNGLVPVLVLIKPEELDGHRRRARARMNRKERRGVTRQLASLLRAKVELVPAVGILRDQGASPAARNLLEDLERHMRDGNSFSSALARHPRVFSPLFVSAVRAGETAGKLEGILAKLVQFDDQQEQLESRFRTALAYPLLLLLLGAACLMFFIWSVVPRMAGLFSQLGGALPWPTRALIAMSEGLSRHWIWITLGLAVAAALLRMLARQPAVISLAESLWLRLPLSHDILEARQISRFTRTLQLLLDSGLPVFQAMDAARPTLSSVRLEARMRDAQERVKRGGSVAESLKAARCFPPIVTHLIAVGESAGTLVDVLDELASYYERLLDETLRVATSLLEPLMIILMGLLVGFCVLAMVLPIFQMTQLVH